jgi:hypothetical protein
MLPHIASKKMNRTSVALILSLAGGVAPLVGCGDAPTGASSSSGEVVSASSSALGDQPDYVPVPHAMVHKSCIHQVPSGARIDKDLNVFVKGQKVAHYDTCPFPAK